MDGVITLNCIIKESPGVVFDITINKNKSILRLKDAIKEKLQDTFRNIDTIGIKLWKVQVAQEDSRLEQLRNPDVSVDNVLDKEEVNEIQRGTDKIGNLFENTDNNNIHVIVQGKENWCSVCGISFKNIALLEDHERNDAHHILTQNKENKMSSSSTLADKLTGWEFKEYRMTLRQARIISRGWVFEKL
ncbi:unnamed protein product [Rhizophagus irregularis]|uniref:C2H2-type domain-containing protein n=1 Tax=Rhizophagus irregularis TaxID=588596 RepID=A0A915YN81_9GLOM|nr:unnamed protein product [Rhizophagus irregularis]